MSAQIAARGDRISALIPEILEKNLFGKILSPLVPFWALKHTSHALPRIYARLGNHH